MLFERCAHAILQGRIHEETQRHHPQECHDVLRLFAREGRGQTARVCAEATFGLHWSCGAGSHLLGRQATVVDLMGDEDDATVLVDEGLPGCAP